MEVSREMRRVESRAELHPAEGDVRAGDAQVETAIAKIPRRIKPIGDIDACLWRDGGLAEVEALMHTLAGGRQPSELSAVMLREHLATGGKRIRARLALGAIEALGGRREDGIGWAAACELVHNATLIHDDLQDGDRTRRGHPTVWALHGAAQAINAGDLMLMLPFLALERVPVSDAVRWRLSRALARGAERTVRGQSLEMELKAARRTDRQGYLEMIEGKTGALFGLPIEGAAYIVGLPEAQVARITREFVRVGLMFQVQDDILDLYGQKGRDERGADIREGKFSALVVEHLRLHPGDRDWLLEILTSPRELTRDADVEAVIDRFREGGALRSLLQEITRQRHAIENGPALKRHPALLELAKALITLILKPISHLDLPSAGGFPS